MKIRIFTFGKSLSSVRVAGILVSAVLALQGVSQASSAEVVVHVAPTGDDAADGSRAKPVASLIGARDAVRRLRADGKAGPVRVVVADGTYRVTEPLVLSPEDGGSTEAPVRYEAAPGAKAAFSGGRRITGFRRGEKGLWVADVPDVAAGQWTFEQLWVDGRRARRAMEPDTDRFFFENVTETKLGGGRHRLTVTASPHVMSLLTPLSPAQRADVKLLMFHSWSNTHRIIRAIDADGRTIRCEGAQIIKPWNRLKDLAWGSRGYFHLENVLSALDEPGEWFLARDGKLYYKPRPGENPASMEFVAPVNHQFLQIHGDPARGRFVQHVHFKGLAFHHGQWLTPAGGYGPGQAAARLEEAAVILDGARHVLFQDCEIARMGGHGLWFRRGCSQCRVERCLFRDLGGGGVRIGEIRIREKSAERTHHIALDNNIIQSGGRIFTDAVGVWIGQSGDNTVTHNDIGDLYYSAVSVGWTWGFGESLAKRNNITYNHLHHLGQRRMSDLAGVYSLGISGGTVISHNVIHDVYCWGYGGWGLYPDEGSSNILFENNLVYNVTDGGFHQHYGRENTVRNNILAFSEQEQVRGTAQKKAGDHLSFTFERNIVYFDRGVLFGRPWQWRADVKVDLRNNIYWRVGGKGLGFAGKSWDQWRAMGRDKGSVIADPKFVDPDSYDFRFASDEVIKQTGFKPFDYSRAGVYGDAAWIALAKATQKANK